jgi:hypothetical protein
MARDLSDAEISEVTQNVRDIGRLAKAAFTPLRGGDRLGRRGGTGEQSVGMDSASRAQLILRAVFVFATMLVLRYGQTHLTRPRHRDPKECRHVY